MTDTHLPHCTVCGSRAESVFCSLAGAHLDHLDRSKTVQRYRRDQTIFQEGHSAFGVYCLYSGRVKLSKRGRQGESQVIRILGPGEFFGFRALIADEVYAASATAIEHVTVCFVSRDTMHELIRESPDLALGLMAKLARELRVSEDQAVEIAQESVPCRTARLLLWLLEAEPEARRSKGIVAAPLKRMDLAQMVGTTPETLSRVLRDFQQRGLIEADRSQIRIKDACTLSRLAAH